MATDGPSLSGYLYPSSFATRIQRPECREHPARSGSSNSEWPYQSRGHLTRLRCTSQLLLQDSC